MKTFLMSCALVLILTLIGFTVISQREDFWISWNREVPSQLTPAELAVPLEDLTLWPIFHHSLKAVSLVNTLKLESGSELRFDIEPKGKEWKRFQLSSVASEVIPGKSVKFLLKEDSKKKLTTIFDDFQWEFSVAEAPENLKAMGFKSLITGKARAHTAHWRGRLFGTISPRILMNQAFYVDLVSLGNFKAQLESAKSNQNLAPSFQ